MGNGSVAVLRLIYDNKTLVFGEGFIFDKNLFMPLPDLDKVPEFYHNYIRQITEEDLSLVIVNHLQPLSSLLQAVSEEDWNYAYAPGKWTLKELVQHIIDGERIFAYRALCIARGDQTSLPGFDENAYAAHSSANARSGASILEELHALDKSTQCLFGSFNDEQLAATGIANGKPISVNAIGYILAGHVLHHTRIIRERYLIVNLQ